MYEYKHNLCQPVYIKLQMQYFKPIKSNIIYQKFRFDSIVKYTINILAPLLKLLNCNIYFTISRFHTPTWLPDYLFANLQLNE